MAKSTDTKTSDKLDTISEKSSIKDIKDDNTEVDDEFKDPVDEAIDLKTIDESSVWLWTDHRLCIHFRN